MKKAYIVLAHKNPEQVRRLIYSLDDGNSTFFIHVDKKVLSPEWRKISHETLGVAAIKSVATKWGGLGLVEATLRGMRAAMQCREKFDFISVVSGQHYPIKGNGDIDAYLRDSQFRTFLEYTSIPDYDRWKIRGGLYRIDKYFIGLRAHERYTAKTMNFLSSKLPFLKRKFPQNMKPFAGSQWFTTDRYTLQYILNFVDNNPGYSAFHKYTFAPDELFFHNILLNANDEKVRSGITNNNLLYMKWPNRDSGHPETLTSTDKEDILNSDALFARKFDMDYDAEIMDVIDKNRHDVNYDIKKGA